MHLTWSPSRVPDVAGYVVYRSDYPPREHRGFSLQLEGSRAQGREPVKAGDVVVVSKKFYATSRSRLLSNRVWGAETEFKRFLPGLVKFFPDETPGKRWELAPHGARADVPDGGDTFLKLALGAGVKERVSAFNHAGAKQSWYEVLARRTYRVEAWLRQEGAGSVKFFVSGFYAREPHKIQPVEFKAGAAWRKFSAEFTPPVVNDGAEPGEMGLEFTGPGTFEVDNLRVYRADAGYLAFLPEEIEALRSSRVGALRGHGTIKTGIATYDLRQLTNPGGAIEATRKANTLPQMLGAFRSAQARPWLQVEFHFSAEEWRALVEYLAAPFDPRVDTPAAKPWAYKRFAQGQRAPWVDQFDRIYLELGNETWNRLFHPWVFEPMRDAVSGRQYSAGEVYGLYQEYVISVLKASPYWKAAGLDGKVQFVLGGWVANPAYGRDAAARSPSSRYLGIGAYNGGWDEAEGPPSLGPRGLFYVLNHVNGAAIPAAEQLSSLARDIPSPAGRRVSLATYEAGPGYLLDGLNGVRVSEAQAQEQEKVMKSLAAGTATLDAFLARAARGFELQNFFTFGSGPYWKSHAHWYDGGHAYPAWQLISLFNREGAGEMLRVETLSVPVADLEAFARRKAVPDAPLVGVYATRDNRRYGVFVISRKVADYPVPSDAGFTPVTLELPFDAAQSVRLFRLSGRPQASRLLGDDPRIEQVAIDARSVARRFVVNEATGADRRGIGPGATLLYVFDGVQP